ncbi:MAG: polysaccharide deacetylase family protein [Deltaproteobacteria bacterium]|nr:polysaccharide deacetylase family protein [Deltaproteobacteria bacterium]
MNVYLLHGTVDDWTPGRMAHQNYVPRPALETYLRQRDRPFAAWCRDATAGDVLTVDDATRAGADACLAARQLGHEVVFFVNAFQIASGQPYFFSLLDAAIDARTVDSVSYAGHTFVLAGAGEIQRFRRSAKTNLASMAVSDALTAATELAQLLGAPEVRVADHQQPLLLNELCRLRAAGVAIENHGWSHVEIGALDDAALVQHVVDGREWLQRSLSVEANLYAVPFGVSDVPMHLQERVGAAYFLCDARLPPRRLSARCWNRRELTTKLQTMNRLSSYISLRAEFYDAGGRREAKD